MQKYQIGTYPYYLWVTCDPSDLKYFKNRNTGKSCQTDDLSSRWDGTTANIDRKGTNETGSLIILGINPLVKAHLNDKEKPYLISVIAHEALHVVSDILDVMHIKYDPYNDEPYAYLMEEIVKYCMNYVGHLKFKFNGQNKKEGGTILYTKEWQGC